jgi:FKBP-type peptidyl-prolyl cis-trans isomerase FklB
MQKTVLGLLGIGMLVTACATAHPIPPGDQRARESYSLGYEFGDNLRRQELNVDRDVLFNAVQEALEGKKPAFDPAEMRDAIREVKQRIMVMQDRRFRKRAATNLAEGKAFLEKNAAQQGVTTLPSGLQYRVLKEGSGPKPRLTDAVRVHFRGALIDGTGIDNSSRGDEFSTVYLSSVISAWKEALQLMRVGAQWRLFVPAGLAYGEHQFGRIPPNSVLIFDLELSSIVDAPASFGMKMGDTQPSTEKPLLQ